MDQPTLRLLIQEKLADGRLPRAPIPRVWGGPGHGESCDGCGETVTSASGIGISAGRMRVSILSRVLSLVNVERSSGTSRGPSSGPLAFRDQRTPEPTRAPARRRSSVKRVTLGSSVLAAETLSLLRLKAEHWHDPSTGPRWSTLRRRPSRDSDRLGSADSWSAYFASRAFCAAVATPPPTTRSVAVLPCRTPCCVEPARTFRNAADSRLGSTALPSTPCSGNCVSDAGICARRRR